MSMSYARIAILALPVVVALGCATATPYQAMDNGRGYSELQLESNRFRVRFSGNSLTSKETVQNYLLYRAAEITLARGDDYFITVDQNTDESSRQYQTFSFGTGFGHWYSRPFGAIGVSTSTGSSQFVAEANILTFSGEKPADNPNAFDAHQIKTNLESFIRRPTAE